MLELNSLYIWLGGTVGAWVMMEVVKFLARERKPKFTGRHAKMLEELHEMHKRTDADGRPVWYVPANLSYIPQENQELLHRIVTSSHMALEHMERIHDEILELRSIGLLTAKDVSRDLDHSIRAMEKQMNEMRSMLNHLDDCS